MLGLELRQEAERLRFYDPATQGYLLSSKELEQQRKLEDALWQAEATRRQAEARIAELEAILRERAEKGLK